MKHAGAECLDALDPVLAQLRAIDGLRERKRGAFYRGAVGFLHFHEDSEGPFADLKKNGDFVRMRIRTRAEIATLIREARRAASA